MTYDPEMRGGATWHGPAAPHGGLRPPPGAGGRPAIGTERGAAAGAPPPDAAAVIGLAALDAMPHGILCLDAALRLHLANAAATALLAQADTPLRWRPDGRVTPAQRAEAEPFARLVAMAAAGLPGGVIGLGSPASPDQRHAAVIAPLCRARPSGGDGPGPGAAERAIILLHRLDRLAEPPGVTVLRGLFGLTRSEAEVARALAGGAPTPAVALARGLKETTVRTQVRAILDKTGAANLRDFERMMAALPGVPADAAGA
jgi:DNA-binding CsgD family transcriptional regulator